jgi:hypothetical protein
MDKIIDVIEKTVKRHGYTIEKYKKGLYYPFYIHVTIKKA